MVPRRTALTIVSMLAVASMACQGDDERPTQDFKPERLLKRKGPRLDPAEIAAAKQQANIDRRGGPCSPLPESLLREVFPIPEDATLETEAERAPQPTCSVHWEGGPNPEIVLTTALYTASKKEKPDEVVDRAARTALSTGEEIDKDIDLELHAPVVEGIGDYARWVSREDEIFLRSGDRYFSLQIDTLDSDDARLEAARTIFAAIFDDGPAEPEQTDASVPSEQGTGEDTQSDDK